MEKINSLEEFDWINEGYQPPNQLNEKSTIQSLLPSFESYFKLLHPVFARETKGGWQETRESGRVYWKDLAEKYGIQFVPQIDWWDFANNKAFMKDRMPEKLFGPGEGNLDESVLTLLQNILTDHVTGNEKIYFCYWLLAREDFVENSVEWSLYRGDLGKVQKFNSLHISRYSPTFWWPESKQWCVYTDFDWSFTFIGGSKELIKQLSGHHEVEGFMIDNQTHIVLR